jgi:hypothetical protein
LLPFPGEERDALAFQIIETLEDEAAWKAQLMHNPARLRAMAEEALREYRRGETHPLDEILIESRVTQSFRAARGDLPEEIQAQARRAYLLFQADPAHPSLRFKKLKQVENVCSVRIGLGYRALGVLEGEPVTWFWIGSHADYDRLACTKFIHSTGGFTKARTNAQS